MKKLIIVLISIAFLATAAFAGTTDTQTVYYEIDAINELAFDAADITLTIDSCIFGAGTQPLLTAETVHYDITTNETAGKKITAALNANMPADTSISVTALAPTGGIGPPFITLSTTASNVVISIETVAESSINCNITLKATVAAGLPPDGSRIITFTLCDE
ncbi:MAG: hypothetical protein ABIH00_06200 [Armatimonadota bacterium]